MKVNIAKKRKTEINSLIHIRYYASDNLNITVEQACVWQL